ncbi:dihydrolipoyl dehydrogenase family protein [Maridesulfovibrio bastinii]|uniref:dihydrolipoyl dehydrogenase family protein n=1 Tax=Maridesulfovibrio bastinii TaxID=47157 RepID=UPI00040A34A8|nr:NAD(P)/FAD-dependent oxidoreductase [Maridesulfovibrio bastinii]
MTKYEYDVAVIGAGPAGGSVAGKCSSAGMKVAVIEKFGLGGTCPLVGCEPKKVLADITETVEKYNNSNKHGVLGKGSVEWSELIKFKRSFTDPITAIVRRHYISKGIDVFDGPAVFSGPQSIKVKGKEIHAKKICIAGGARPRTMGITGEELVSTSTDFFEFDELPKRISFIGGGFISFELAHIAALAGVKATIINRSDRVLRNFDIDLTKRLCAKLEDIGVKIVMNEPAVSLQKTDSGLILKTGPQGNNSFEADCFIHGAGRIPDIEGLRADIAGVETTSGGIDVNEYMQSVSNPSVYAAGDVVNRGMPLTPVASLEAEIAADSIINGNNKTIDYGLIPYALFTYPPIAAVGLLEEKAREKGLDFEVLSKDASRWSEYKRLGQDCAEFKLLIEKGSRLILGAHIMGDRAEEIINLITLGMRCGITIDALADMVWAYPSFGYTLKYLLR